MSLSSRETPTLEDGRFLCTVVERVLSLRADTAAVDCPFVILSTTICALVSARASGSSSQELNSHSSQDECWMFHADGKRNIINAKA